MSLVLVDLTREEDAPVQAGVSATLPSVDQSSAMRTEATKSAGLTDTSFTKPVSGHPRDPRIKPEHSAIYNNGPATSSMTGASGSGAPSVKREEGKGAIRHCSGESSGVKKKMKINVKNQNQEDEKPKPHKHKHKHKQHKSHQKDRTPAAPADKDGDISDKEEIRAGSPTPVSFPQPPVSYDPDKRRPYQCKYCNGRFLSTKLWELHVAKHEVKTGTDEDNVPQYECSVCARKFLYYESRQTHCLIRHPDQFIPPPCFPARDSGLKSNALSVKRSHTPDIKSSILMKKKKDVSDKKKKRKHGEHGVEEKKRKSRSDQNPEYRPPNKQISPSQILSRHALPDHLLKRTPEKGRDYKEQTELVRVCVTCRQNFATAATYEFHYPCYEYTKFRVMAGYKCYKCKDSSIIYGNLDELRLHAVDHGLPKFSCSYCDCHKFTKFEIEHHVSQTHPAKLKIDKEKPSDSNEVANKDKQGTSNSDDVPCTDKVPDASAAAQPIPTAIS